MTNLTETAKHIWNSSNNEDNKNITQSSAGSQECSCFSRIGSLLFHLYSVFTWGLISQWNPWDGVRVSSDRSPDLFDQVELFHYVWRERDDYTWIAWCSRVTSLSWRLREENLRFGWDEDNNKCYDSRGSSRKKGLTEYFHSWSQEWQGEEGRSPKREGRSQDQEPVCLSVSLNSFNESSLLIH